ncbi:MAG: cytochrome c3 family protein, partial [Pseudomonadota bacterium]
MLRNFSKKHAFSALFACLLAGAFLLMSGHQADAAKKKRTFKRKECVDCHTQFKEEVLSRNNLHDILKNGDCEQCHLRHGLVGKLILKEDGEGLCISCHSEDDLKLNRKVVHQAVESGDCTACHDPHASEYDNLLRAEGGDTCYKCHDKEDYEKKVRHAVLDDGGCAVCHEPHSSDQADLLKEKPEALCLSCHDSGQGSFKEAHGGYPVQDRECATCHSPHSSTAEKLLKSSSHVTIGIECS